MVFHIISVNSFADEILGEKAGLAVVMDKCMMQEHKRLFHIEDV